MKFIAHTVSQAFWLGFTFTGMFIAQSIVTKDNFIIEPIACRSSSQTAIPFLLKPLWNSSHDPVVFSHDSDIHVSPDDEDSRLIFRNNLIAVNSFNPVLHILTGDLTNDIYKAAKGTCAGQVEEGWMLYRDTINSIEDRKYKIIDMPGNHDMWGLNFIDSPNFNLLKYSQTFNLNNSRTIGSLQIRVIKDEYPGHPIVIINPFYFPVGFGDTFYWIEASAELLERIEDAIIENPHCIVVSHFPPDNYRLNRNTYGHNIREIVSHQNVDLILTGHFHQNHPISRHHGKGVLEINGVGGMKHSIFEVITEDNGQFVYHEIDSKKPENFLITNPVPIKQISYKTIFNEKNTEIRILSTKINATIYANNIKLDFIRKTNNDLFLYSTPYTIEKNGEYTIHFSGDFNKTETFLFNQSYLVTELPIESPHSLFVRNNTIIFMIIMFQFILFPLKIYDFDFLQKWIMEEEIIEEENKRLAEIEKNLYIEENNDEEKGKNEEKMEIEPLILNEKVVEKRSVKQFFKDGINKYKNNGTKHSGVVYWLTDIFCGFLAVRSRILSAPLYVRLVLYISATWPIIFPISFMEIDNHFSVNTIYGYYSGSRQVFACTGLSNMNNYMMFVMIPFTFLASGISTLYGGSNKGYKIHYGVFIELVFPIVCIIAIIPGCLGQYSKYYYLSPCFVFIPAIVFSTIIVWLIQESIRYYNEEIKNKKNTKKPKNTVSLAKLLD